MRSLMMHEAVLLVQFYLSVYARRVEQMSDNSSRLVLAGWLYFSIVISQTGLKL